MGYYNDNYNSTVKDVLAEIDKAHGIGAKMIIDERKIDMKSLWKYHANLE